MGFITSNSNFCAISILVVISITVIGFFAKLVNLDKRPIKLTQSNNITT